MLIFVQNHYGCSYLSDKIIKITKLCLYANECDLKFNKEIGTIECVGSYCFIYFVQLLQSWSFFVDIHIILLKLNNICKNEENLIWPCGSASSAVVSLITPGTMGHLFQYSSEGNIFTTHRSMKKAAVSKDFCLCFFSLFFFYLLNYFDVAKHQCK